MTLRLFIWEGHGISDAYHDDGTLVVLAESAEGARAVIRAGIAERAEQDAAFYRARDAYLAELDAAGASRRGWTNTERGRVIWAMCPPFSSLFFDGSDRALDREPDRIVDIDGPKWVAFNGGGYD